MKAVVHQEPFKVTVEQMPDPKIEAPTDTVVRTTTTNICGPDLHVYEGRTPAEPGFIFGRENMGIVVAAGYQAHGPDGNEDPMATLEGCVNLYAIGGPGAPDEAARQGYYPFPTGLSWMKGPTLGTGQANVKRYDRYLRDPIASGRAIPSQIVSHEPPLDEAHVAHDEFDRRVDGYTKVILKP